MNSSSQPMSVQHIEKKTTPSVPTPDWSTNFNNEMETGNEETAGHNNLSLKQLQNNTEVDSNSLLHRLSVISSVSNKISHTSSGNITNNNQTPQFGTSCSSLTTPAMPTAQSYIAGEVALTPTHSSFTPQAMNPHSVMTAITPMVSGTDQAKNSIKIQEQNRLHIAIRRHQEAADTTTTI